MYKYIMLDVKAKILEASKKHDVLSMGIRPLGRLIGIDSPQLVKHHLNQLIKSGLLNPKSREQIIQQLQHAEERQPSVFRIPVVGRANCGTASWVADEHLEGYITVSESLVGRNSNIFALLAMGTSMTKADINGKNIEEGDFVVVDGNRRNPNPGDYILSVIDGLANIKKFARTRDGNVALLSESTDKHAPIIINETDNFLVNGKVIQVIKTAK